jgi:nucleotide-binding universal stress UspA family protein
LTNAAVPVLLVAETRPAIAKVLICTAAGEPGKVDVLFGGRVARRSGAQVIVLHVLNPQASAGDRHRIERHLQQAKRSLDGFGVQNEYRIKEGTPLIQGILQEAEEGDYDLIVIGAPLLPRSNQLRWLDAASQIIQGTSRPVLVVPMIS